MESRRRFVPLSERLTKLTHSVSHLSNYSILQETCDRGFSGEVIRLVARSLRKTSPWSSEFAHSLNATIKVLNVNSDYCRDTIAETGFVADMLPHLEKGANVSKIVAQNITHAFSTLSLSSSASTLESLAPAIPTLARIASEGTTERWRSDAMWALYRLATKNMTRRAMIADAGAIPPLLEMVSAAQSSDSRIGAAWAVAIIVANNQTRVEMAMNENAIVTLLSSIDQETNEIALSAMVAALNNIVSSNRTRVEIATQNDAIRILNRILLMRVGQSRMSKHRETVHHVADVFSLMAFNPDTRKQMIGKGVNDAIVFAIKDDILNKNFDGEALESLCQTVANMAAEPKLADAMIESGAAPVLVQIAEMTGDDG